MKFNTLLCSTVGAFALFAGAPALAQEADAAPVEQTEADAAEATEAVEEQPGSPALWQVSDEDTTIYLFGTVHMLPQDVDWYSGPVKEAISSSDSLVTEIDMNPELTAAMGQLIGQKGMLTDGQTLRSLMTDEQRATYEEGLAKVGIPPEAFDGMEPWLASIALLQIVTQASGFSDDLGVEKVLEATVPEGTERVALETVEFQISIFDELPVDQQILFLLEGAGDPMAGIETLNQLVTEWAEGDVEELGNLMNEGMMAHPNLAEQLLYMRNENWAEWIDTRMDDPGTVFIAVGAGHLAGERSVQDYLATRGITVNRVQ
ncbi:TraB/GumN family protein [Erythrobacter rubeus]|uniref:TraB/GumN family protein n=1 Tax=Erythrobacter rubeus TaxID=2760803 RepID=A0ABR8KRJ0_9SPHN|nr:TraB/GumN family protein [Erythrobacter rubeus]MBD2841843.1 TraB/GumN family protein [Erythrobacter rubeus]